MSVRRGCNDRLRAHAERYHPESLQQRADLLELEDIQEDIDLHHQANVDPELFFY